MIWWPVETPTLYYGNISLRPPQEADVDSIFQACQDPLIPRFTTVPSPYELEHAETFIASAPARLLDKRELLFVISSREGGEDEFCGVISFHTVNLGNHSSEVGYWLASSARGRGIGRISLGLISDYGFTTMGFRRLEALVDVANLASKSILLSAGYELEGILKQKVTRPSGEQIDMALFAKTHE